VCDFAFSCVIRHYNVQPVLKAKVPISACSLHVTVSETTTYLESLTSNCLYTLRGCDDDYGSFIDNHHRCKVLSVDNSVSSLLVGVTVMSSQYAYPGMTKLSWPG